MEELSQIDPFTELNRLNVKQRNEDAAEQHRVNLMRRSGGHGGSRSGWSAEAAAPAGAVGRWPDELLLCCVSLRNF